MGKKDNHPIRICILTTISETMGWFVTDTARYLRDHGFEVTLVCNMPPEFQKENSDYASCVAIPMKRGMDPVNAWSSFRSIYKLFRAEKYDIIQYSTPNASLYAALAGKLAGIKVRLYCQWGLRYVSEKGKKRTFMKALEKLTCLLSTQVEPDSRGNLKLGRKEGLFSSKKSSVVWNGSAAGVDMDRFQIASKDAWRDEIRREYGIPADAYVFGFVGRTDRDKGFNEMMQAFRSLSKDSSSMYLLMVGMEDKTETLDKELYQWSKGSDMVIYTGSVRDPQRYMAAMDCLLLPSYREGFGSVVIEAGAMGVPVIASDIEGPRESLKDRVTGLFVKPGSAEDLFQKMEYFYRDPDEGKRMGSAAVAHVKGRYDSKKLHEYIAEDRRRLVNKSHGEKRSNSEATMASPDRKTDWQNYEYPNRVSVIMGIYNCAETLKEAIDCILNQTYSDWELIMCDDGSSDSTYETAKSIAARHPDRILVLRNARNRGLNYTLNRCLKKARGGFIARMDGDDLCSPDRFEKEIEALRNHPEIAIVSTAMEFFDESGVWGIIRHPEFVSERDFASGSPFCHAPCMVRHEAYEAVKGYTVDPRLLRLEDYHLWIKMYREGYRGMNLQEPYYQMRDDRNAYSRRKFRYRINEAYVTALAVKELRLPKRNLLRAARPILVGLLPKPVYDRLHKKRLVGE
ncbi:MAG: glycosyltransferase [Lachnospiraceae bacterium]|nr:glycosyltransferase [Lachnospiraceae bacterium]